MSDKGAVGIVGSGIIGRSWAMLFASAGYNVSIYDIEEKQVSVALESIERELAALELNEKLRGNLNAKKQFALIRGSPSLEDCISNCIHVQECVPENLELKLKIFKEMDNFAGPNTVLSSSTSCIVPSKFTEDLVNKANCIVSHPVNPPYYVPVVEVVPAPWTSKEVVKRTCNLLKDISLSPVVFTQEIPGFAVNRIQYAILNECWHLVKGGYLSAEDVDRVMSDGLALRYAWIGPLKTAHLNAEGFDNYVERYGSTISSVSKTFKDVPSWTREDAGDIATQLEANIPLDKLEERRTWREERLVALDTLKKQMKQKEG